MGVESDRLVLDYLSRVGDLAQTAMPASQRMQLVAQLRNDIDRQRGRAEGDSPATVRRILGRIGTPDEVVEAAAGSSDGSGSGSASGSRAGSGSRSAQGRGQGAGADPQDGVYGPYAKRGPQVPRARKSERDGGGEGRGDTAGRGRSRDEEPDWWRTDPSGRRPRAGDELAGLPGMTGGVFIPFDDEDLDEKDEPPARRARGAAKDAAADGGDDEEAYDEEEAEAAPRRRTLRRGLRRVGSGWGSPTLLLAAALLIGGAALGSLIALGLGWLLAYFSRALSRTQAKFAVLGIPGAAAAALVVWVWGRDAGKWGTPVAKGQMGHVFKDDYPTAVRLAAVATALYLLWRSRRRA
ncbi:hypothetical protein [Streptomyces sp. NPDC020917]|uniref:hypothetical protein n=1 Tax=Streptomyces sp. NPDC020917 TaxID=3365102 RepID=UPI0037ACC24A